MKKFRFRYSPLVIILCLVVIGISAVGVALNIVNIVNSMHDEMINIISYYFLCAVCLILGTLSFIVLINGKYYIKDKKLFTIFGFIKSSINIDDIVEINLFKKSQSLVIYLSNGTYTVAVISQNDYDQFISQLRNQNPLITYHQEEDEYNKK